MDPVIVTPPAVEPVTLAEARSHLQLPSTFTDQDGNISEWITSARRKIESLSGRCFVYTTWDWTFDAWPLAPTKQALQYRSLNMPIESLYEIRPPRTPLASVTSITYFDPQGNPQTLDPSLYIVLPGTPGRILPSYQRPWPAVRLWPGSITIRFVAGYSADASGVPSTVKSFIKLAVGAWFQERSAVARQRPRELPYAVEWLAAEIDDGIYD